MMTGMHVCDPNLDTTPDDTPLTRSRVLRLMLAHLDPGTDLIEAVTRLVGEVGDCPRCLIAMVLMTGGVASSLCEHMSGELRTEVIADLDRQLAEALDQLTTEG